MLLGCGSVAGDALSLGQTKAPVGTFTYILLAFMVNVGKYTNPMNPMGRHNFPPGFSVASRGSLDLQ